MPRIDALAAGRVQNQAQLENEIKSRIDDALQSLEDLVAQLNLARQEVKRLERKQNRSPADDARLQAKRAEVRALEGQQQHLKTVHEGLKAEQHAIRDGVISKQEAEGLAALKTAVGSSERTVADMQKNADAIRELASKVDPSLKNEVAQQRVQANVGPQARGDWKPPAHVRSYKLGPELHDVRNGATLQRGHMSGGVEQAQGKLNAALKGCGVDALERDGLFGPKTEHAVRVFQESRGLQVTGKLDQATLAALDANKPVVKGWKPSRSSSVVSDTGPSGVTSGPTAGMTEEQKFNHYKGLIEKSGGKFNPNGPNIIGVRTATDADANRGGGRYDDTMAVIWKDKSGKMRVREFRGNTEPSARYRGSMGRDVDGDGRLDQGRLRAGHYTYSTSTFKGAPALRMVGDSVVDRDTNQDGIFGNDRGAKSRGGASMLFHAGGSTTTGSAGCQTLPPAEFDRFISTLKEAGLRRGGRVGYTLVDAS